MSGFEKNEPGQVLRDSHQHRGVRRLPVRPKAVESAPSPAPTEAHEDPIDLRVVYADELRMLSEEVRAEAVKDGQAALNRELDGMRERMEADLNSRFARRLEEEQQKLADQRAQLRQLVDELEAARGTLAEKMLPTLKRLSLSVVLSILGGHASTRSLIGDLAQRAIEQYRLDGVVRIQVSEEDYQAILAQDYEQDFIDLFHVDREAMVGSCIIDYGTGLLDAGLDTQLDALKATLLGSDDGHVG